MLHGTKVAYVNNMRNKVAVYQGSNEINEEPEIMLHIYRTFPNYIRTVLFFDDCSSCSLIAHKVAGFLGLEGRVPPLSQGLMQKKMISPISYTLWSARPRRRVTTQTLSPRSILRRRKTMNYVEGCVC
jgi:hypothetical protein